MAPSLAELPPAAAVAARGLSESQGVLLTHLVVWILTVVAGLSLSLRFFAKWYRKAVLRVDDGLLAAAWVLMVLYATVTSLELALGMGGSRPPETAALLLLDNLARTYALAAAAWSKSALACTLLVVGCGGGGGRRAVIRWALVVLVLLLNADAGAAAAAHWVRCRPAFKAWDAAADGSCWPPRVDAAVQIGAQAYLAFSDIALVVAGYLLVWSADLRLGEKVGIGFLAALGLTASAGAIVTAVEISTLTTDNFTTNNMRVLLTASIDPTLTILASALSTTALLLGHHHDDKTSRPTQQPNNDKKKKISVLRNIRITTTTTKPTDPPARPPRPTSTRSFMTTDTRSQHGDRAETSSSTDNLLLPAAAAAAAEPLPPSFSSYWNPTVTTPRSPPGTASTSRTLTNSNTTPTTPSPTLKLPPGQPNTYSTYSPYGNNPPFFAADKRLTTLEEEEAAARASYSSTVRSSSRYSALGTLLRHVEGILPTTTNNGRQQHQQQHQQQQYHHHTTRSRDSPTLGLGVTAPSWGGGMGRGSLGARLDVADDYFNSRETSKPPPSRPAAAPPSTAPAWSQRFTGYQL